MSKPTGKQKPKPPPYPRPVPEFVVEELPPRSEDIVWNAVNGGGYYSDEDGGARDGVQVEQRVAKRRRIEACARAYLRGEPLYIMSAQLKGPFNGDWRNPWAKTRTRPKFDGVKHDKKALEIPETAKKIPCSVDEEKAIGSDELTTKLRPDAREEAQRNKTSRSVVLNDAPSPFTSRIRNVSSELSPKVPRKIKEIRVKEWLRKNDDFAKTDEILVQSSPTPVSRVHKITERTPDRGVAARSSQSEPLKGLPPKASPVNTAFSLQPKSAHRTSGSRRRVQKLSRDMQSMIAEPLAHTSGRLLDEVKKTIFSIAGSDQLPDHPVAEFAALKAKRSSLHMVPADLHMSPFEFRKVSGRDGHVLEGEEPSANTEAETIVEHEAAIGEAEFEINVPATEMSDNKARGPDEDVFVTAPQPENEKENIHPQDLGIELIPTSMEPLSHQADDLPVKNAYKPVLSTAVSEISTTDMLPSAQPRLEPEYSVSSVTHEKLLSIKPPVSDSERVECPAELNDVGETNELTTGIEKSTEAKDMTPVPLKQHESVNVNDKASTPVSIYNAMALDTQEMIANIEPLELSTIKRPKDLGREIPTTATKYKADRKRKKTSFATDPSAPPSQGSIRDVMKAKISKQLGSSPMFLFSKEDLDIEVSDEENESPQKRSRSSHGAGKPKSILESTNPTSPSNSLRKSRTLLSTGQERTDARQRNLLSGQNAIEEDNFDLDAAIDDLGSFLGTWDPEKEASSLDMGL